MTSEEPIIPNCEGIDLDGDSKHFAGTGAFKPSMQEIPTSLIKIANHMFVDSPVRPSRNLEKW